MSRERFGVVETLIGSLVMAVTDRGVSRVSFDWSPFDGVEDQDAVSEVAGQITEYFAGRRKQFEVEVDLSGVSGFTRQILEGCLKIPFGEVLSYGELAEASGNPRAARAVGGALNRNPVGIIVPCHRVVGSTGELTGFAGGLHRKRALLTLERRGPEAMDDEWSRIGDGDLVIGGGPRRVQQSRGPVGAGAGMFNR